MISAFFLTNAVLAYDWLAVDHEVSGPGIRVVDTLVGIGLAISGAALVALVTSRRHHDPADSTS